MVENPVLHRQLVLAVDTSQLNLSLAIAQGSKVLSSVVDESTLPHSSRLFPLIIQMLDGLALSLSSIDVFAINRGPGSFTGLRVGIAACQGIAQTLGKPLLGINKIDALAIAQNLPASRLVILLKAGCDAYFCGTRRLQGDLSLVKVGVDRLIYAVNAVAEVRQALGTTPAIFLGDGATALWPELTPETHWQLREPATPLVNSIAQWAATQSSSGTDLTAYYLRQSDAESKRRA